MTKNTGIQGRTEQQQPSALDTYKTLIVDVAVPVGGYYLLKHSFGMSTFAALAWSSVVPAVRTVWGLVKERRTNGLALLILVVNVVGLALSFVSGDPRLMLAKDSGISSTVGIGILVSVALGKPMMTAGLKPFMLKGDAAKEAAWERLTSGAVAASAEFRKRERVFSLVWGWVLLAECVVRVVGAYTLPVDTMVWLGSGITIGAIALAAVVCGPLATRRMEAMIGDEVRAAEAGRTVATVAA